LWEHSHISRVKPEHCPSKSFTRSVCLNIFSLSLFLSSNRWKARLWLRCLNDEFGTFPMKMTSKTILSFISAGLLLCASGAYVLAQTDTPSPKPLSPKALKKLCTKTPTDPRCPQDKSGAPTSTDPTAPGNSGSMPMPSPSSDVTPAPAPGVTAPTTLPGTTTP
jgi:hypothetical protein